MEQPDSNERENHKWIERHGQESFAGLRDRLRAPLHQASAVEDAIEQELLCMKARWPLWCADFKGWFKLGNGERCDPLTITDAASRCLIRSQGLCGKTST